MSIQKVVTIHQPEHLPWCGYFNKMRLADHYVILDDVQFKKNNYQNRNRILTPYGVKWLSVPIQMKGHISKTIQNMEVIPDWESKYWGLLAQSYGKHPFYKIYSEELNTIVFSGKTNILDINMDWINFFRKLFQIKTPLSFSSSLGLQSTSTQRLVEICQRHEASEYLAGGGAKDYLETELFDTANISLSYHDFSPRRYSQHQIENFEPYMSALDLIMNVEPNSYHEYI
ncbi:MAG: WbqC family protein [SAR324 cluster bacterium]|nr:WbqC family protein [SAR324 cluster bacterium]